MMATLNFTVPDSTPLLIEYTYTLNYNLDKLTARAFDVKNSAYIAGSTADAWNTKDNYSISDDGASAGFGVTKVNLTVLQIPALLLQVKTVLLRSQDLTLIITTD